MKKSAKLTVSALLVSLCGTFAAIANTDHSPATIKQRYLELQQVCEYNPDECIISTLGAGNGGGNEPPYTPRKPKKEPKKPNDET